LADSLPLEELSGLYREASLFVLATRTRPWDCSAPSGEGLGLVLAEAQLAGLPVIAPASGGSSSAYLDGETGLRPIDESAQSLARCMLKVLSDPLRYVQLSRRALEWAPRKFDPGRLREWLAQILELGEDPTVHRRARPDIEPAVVDR
jgi:glycosyltransferase involved in cell wall biosynthesis